MPVLYWMASWWILPPGLEPGLVSLAPLSHSASNQANSSVMNDISILVLKTQELNPSPLKADQTPQDGPGPADLLSHRLKLLSCPATCQPNTEDSPNGCQIATKPVPLETHTYTGNVVCLKEVGKRPATSPANKHQLLPVFCPEKVLQLANSDDMVNNGSKTKHCHFCSQELVQPRTAKLVPLRAQTYAEAVAWARSTTSPANKHQLLPVPSPERELQLACSGDMMNQSSKIKRCHFCLPESDALQTLSQDPCPTGKLPINLKPAKSKKVKSHSIKTLAVW
ncbi:hypothetical protein DSO57_1006184 [Entomophthora muscae]|uniref:Uncharacterized protein n=1 Tax=Entomophthora muscae TaxID=34485 RepID=A0ACC2RMF8_9FUNG|nr:hypothetical protein DSO57_1006184 [Entomophthora muscae]